MALTRKQRVFVEEYLTTWNASEAARRAGYTGKANAVGPRLLANVSIQEEIRRRVAEKAMAADEVLVRLAEQARLDLSPYIIDENGEPKIDVNQLIAAGLGRFIKGIRPTANGPQIEFEDKFAALQLIGKHLGLFKDHVEHNARLQVEYINDWRASE